MKNTSECGLCRRLANITFIVSLSLLGDGCRESPNLDSRANRGRAEPFRYSTPSVSHDETAIVYDSDESGNGDIYRLGFPAGRVTRLTASPDVEMRPVFSPDGKWIVFARQSEGYQHVWIMRSDGSQQTGVTSGRVLDEPTSFSENGETLFFIRTSFFGRALLPKRELFSVSLTNTSQPAKRLGAYACIAPNATVAISNSYAMDTGKEELWLVELKSGQTRSVGSGSVPGFSPEGERFVYLVQKPDYRHEVVLRALDREEGQTIPFPPGYKFKPAFCRQGRAVIVRIPTTERDGVGGVYITDLQTFETEKISTIPGGKL